MSNAFRTMIVPAEHVELARKIAAALSPNAGVDMWGARLSPNGQAPATHYVSTGLIGAQFAALMNDPEIIHTLYLESGWWAALEQVEQLVQTSDVSEEPPFTAFARLGLMLVREEV